MRKGRFAGQPEPRTSVSRSDLFDMSDAALVYLAAKYASWDDVDLSGETDHGCVQQSGVRVGPDQRYRRVVAD